MNSPPNDAVEEGELDMEQGDFIGGYELEFLDKVPIFAVCPICTCVVRNPLQSTCCGKLFCSSCLIALSNTQRPYHKQRTCPHCRRHPMGHCYPDRNAERLIMDLRTKCENHGRGCEWSGELRSLQTHRQSCIHELVPCPNQCGEKFLRSHLHEHATTSCINRLHTCKDCGLEDTYSHITTEHYFLCPEATIMCTNEGCWASFKRSEKAEHEAQCPKEVLVCPYVTVGCRTRVRREELGSHKRDNMEQHLALAIQGICKLDRVMYSYQEELHRLGRHSQVVLRMGKFAEFEEAHEWWHSPYFYTSPCGYRVSLLAGMVGEYFSVYLCLERGEYDNILSWPMRGSFLITLLNQLEDSHHHSATLNFDSGDSTQTNSRVMAGRGRGYGFPYFISWTQLKGNPAANCQYLKDNAVFFSVNAMEMSSITERTWLSMPITYMYP